MTRTYDWLNEDIKELAEDLGLGIVEEVGKNFQLVEDTLIGGKLIPKGYVNLTAMCQSQGKHFNSYKRLKNSELYIDALSREAGIPVSALIIEIRCGPKQCIWGHFDVAIDVARWISPQFGVWVNKVLKPI